MVPCIPAQQRENFPRSSSNASPVYVFQGKAVKSLFQQNVNAQSQVKSVDLPSLQNVCWMLPHFTTVPITEVPPYWSRSANPDPVPQVVPPVIETHVSVQRLKVSSADQLLIPNVLWILQLFILALVKTLCPRFSSNASQDLVGLVRSSVTRVNAIAKR
jgi:hypothetical protein